jgi:hypothetical protein
VGKVAPFGDITNTGSNENNINRMPGEKLLFDLCITLCPIDFFINCSASLL